MTAPAPYPHDLLNPNAEVAIVVGSISDWQVMKSAADIFEKFGVAYEALVLSAHRLADEMADYAKQAQKRGLKAIIAGAGGAAHLPGMLAAYTWVPVLGVPVPSTGLLGVDSLYSIVQMPKGTPVATFAIGTSGAVNAALFAVALMAQHSQDLQQQLTAYRQRLSEQARTTVLKLHD